MRHLSKNYRGSKQQPRDLISANTAVCFTGGFRRRVPRLITTWQWGVVLLSNLVPSTISSLVVFGGVLSLPPCHAKTNYTNAPLRYRTYIYRHVDFPFSHFWYRLSSQSLLRRWTNRITSQLSLYSMRKACHRKTASLTWKWCDHCWTRRNGRLWHWKMINLQMRLTLKPLCWLCAPTDDRLYYKRSAYSP